jgi:hypothetical protein
LIGIRIVLTASVTKPNLVRGTNTQQIEEDLKIIEEDLVMVPGTRIDKRKAT